MSAQLPIRVLLVDDHAVVRQGYRRLLEACEHIIVAGECSDAEAALRFFSELSPDVVVMDIALPGVSGIEALRRILLLNTQAKVLMFSMYDEPIYVQRALQAGACGFVTKASAPEVLVAAVDAVAQGRKYLSQDAAQHLALRSAGAEGQAPERLSSREFEVLRLLVAGQSIRNIADSLHLTPKTVANHQSAIKQKLGVSSSVQLALKGAELLNRELPD
ncbi:MAG: response regulator transcription factor [Proteobacteria bacterium]|nr:response regulator transcription factor [Pseudomonadota bacterium]